MHPRSMPLVALLTLALAVSACGVKPLTGTSAATIKDVSGVLTAHAVAAPPEVIVATTSAAPLKAANTTEIDHFTFGNQTYHLLGASSAAAITTVVQSLRGNAGVVLADDNLTVSALDVSPATAISPPDNEFYPMQYGLIQKDIPAAWKITQGDPNLIVGIVDTGIDLGNAKFANRIIKGPNFLFRPGWIFHRTDTVGPQDDNSHGTHCAGIIGASANDGTGIAGVAPGVKLMAVKSLDARGAGTEYDVMKGVAYAVTNGAKIISLSLGGTSTTSVERKFYQAVVDAGVLVVAAAGNSSDAVGFPAAYPGVLSVGATDSGGNLAKFSNHDETMGVTAPGVGILSTVPGGGYAKMSGTSMSAPFVAGCAALVWSAHPDWTGQQVIQRIETTADDKGAPGVDSQYGHGEIDVMAALAGSETP